MQINEPSITKPACKCASCACVKENASKVADTSRKVWIGSGEDLYTLSEVQHELANA